jgi:hypothetical protein
MTKTRQVDEFGNVFYVVHEDDGRIIGRINKTCSGWQAELPGDGGYCPVRSVTAGMQWFERRQRILDMPVVEG